MLKIRNNDVKKAIEIMKEVAAWGRDKGLRVWLDHWLTEEELITREAQPENFYVGSIDGNDACSFILQWEDSEWWPDAPKYEAAYMHKFCVRREYAHRNMTIQVVEAIKEECRKYGARYIRLDTANDEKIVKDIYLKAGFEIVKVIKFHSGKEMALYELKISNFKSLYTIKRGKR